MCFLIKRLYNKKHTLPNSAKDRSKDQLMDYGRRMSLIVCECWNLVTNVLTPLLYLFIKFSIQAMVGGRMKFWCLLTVAIACAGDICGYCGVFKACYGLIGGFLVYWIVKNLSLKTLTIYWLYFYYDYTDVDENWNVKGALRGPYKGRRPPLSESQRPKPAKREKDLLGNTYVYKFYQKWKNPAWNFDFTAAWNDAHRRS